MKTEIEHFRDWENHVFGFGYGSGEDFVIPALHKFMQLCNRDDNDGAYNFEVLEKELTPTVAWLLINILCHADVIEYGTSPRFGWMDFDFGARLRAFILSKTPEQLIEIVTGYDSDYCHCTPTYCNCDDEVCHNPFWREKKDRASNDQ